MRELKKSEHNEVHTKKKFKGMERPKKAKRQFLLASTASSVAI
jgi:hypothetical protein